MMSQVGSCELDPNKGVMVVLIGIGVCHMSASGACAEQGGVGSNNGVTVCGVRIRAAYFDSGIDRAYMLRVMLAVTRKGCTSAGLEPCFSLTEAKRNDRSTKGSDDDRRRVMVVHIIHTFTLCWQIRKDRVCEWVCECANYR